MTVVCLAAVTVLLGGCAFMSGSRLDEMFGGKYTSNQTSAYQTPAGSDFVTIPKTEYERLSMFSEMAEIMDAVDQNFFREADHQKMLDYAAKGLMAGLDDPYSFYYTPEEFEAYWENDDGNYVGIGVLISANYETQICTISRVFEGSPAMEAGVQRGDILYRVGEDLMVGADNLQEAVNIMRGEPDTLVDVTFLRRGEEITFTIPRRAVTVNRIESTMLDDQVGYIALYEFEGKSDAEFEKALKDLIQKGSKGIVLDLRDNGGGWVDQAQFVADLFMDEGELLYFRYGNGEEVHDEFRTKDGKVDQKIVVLINEMSASSSEILTGALRDRIGAKVVGTQSFGKGIVQEMRSVGYRGAGYQLTIAQYFTPNGYAVHEQGITPDYIVERPEEDTISYEFADLENDVQLKKAYEVMLEELNAKE